MKRTYLTLILLAIIQLINPAYAKIGDCPAIEYEGVLYISHSDYIEAVQMSDDELIWHTRLFSERYFDGYNPLVESDVQANISCVEAVTADEVNVTDKMHRQFYVDRKTGELLRTIKDGQRIANPVLDENTDILENVAISTTNTDLKHDDGFGSKPKLIIMVGVMLGLVGIAWGLAKFRKKTK